MILWWICHPMLPYDYTGDKGCFNTYIILLIWNQPCNSWCCEAISEKHGCCMYYFINLKHDLKEVYMMIYVFFSLLYNYISICDEWKPKSIVEDDWFTNFAA